MAKTKEVKEKDNSFEAALAKLEKDFGKGTIMGANSIPDKRNSISSGSIALDKALGVGGYPTGRIVEVIGPESAGKTTLVLHAIAEGQKKYPNKKFAFVDAEHALDKYYAESLGVDLSRLLISQPDYGEQALEVVHRLLATGEMGIIVVDSVAALTPKSEIDGEIGDSSIGKQARMMGQALRILCSLVQKTEATLIFTNQIREKIGVMFGSNETTPGGNALKFYASVRLDIRKIATNKDGTGDDAESISNTVRVKVKKNKVAPPFTQAEFDINFGSGIFRLGEIIEMGVDLNIIVKAGAHYSYNETNIAHGKDKLIEFLEDNSELVDEIEAKIRTILFDKSLPIIEEQIIIAEDVKYETVNE